MAPGHQTLSSRRGPRALRHRLIVVLMIYVVAGTASQKLVPGVDEIFPFFGWSLFSRVPDLETRYTVRIETHNGRRLDPPVSFLHAPATMVTGNRYIGRKVVQQLGQAQENGDAVAVKKLRRQLERNYFVGEVGYELALERYEPLEMWTTGEAESSRHLARYASSGSR